jgi:hypothetical protein
MASSFSCFPTLTELDPKIASEGNLDPLGLYSIADALGTRLVPGVRQRQSHPRYLTAIAVGLELISDFPADLITEDGSAPWQVYEWLVVQGLVDRLGVDHPDEIRGLPGREKVAKVLEAQVPLSAKRYLKTPGTFGFHGVYRVLARDLKIEQGGLPGELGAMLVNTWAKEQGLLGFVGSSDGLGKKIKGELRSAIFESIQLGAVAKKRNWSRWDFFKDHLSPYRAGANETELLFQALQDSAAPLRREVFSFLGSKDGQGAWRGEKSERAFHQALGKKASRELRTILKVVDLYEQFARTLQDAFDDSLFYLTQKQGGGASPAELSGLPTIKKGQQAIADRFDELSGSLEAFGQSVRFEESFSSFREKMDSQSWVQTLMEHHRKIQARKPPNGKSPWVETLGDGSYFVRSAYRRAEEGKHNTEYVHAYRTNPLWSFLLDFKKVSV